MPKNKGRGGKNRKKGKNENINVKRELVFKEEGTEYAQVLKMLGNGRLEAKCFDGQKRLGHIRGKMRKKVWIGVDDIVLVTIREFQDDKCDVILKYLPDEVRALKAYGELPESIEVNENNEGTTEVVDFIDDSGSDDSDDSEEAPTKPVKKAAAPVKKEDSDSDDDIDDI